MPIINYDGLKEIIDTIDDILSDYDRDEKALILNTLMARFAATQEEQKMKDMMSKVSDEMLHSMMGKVMNRNEDSD